CSRCGTASGSRWPTRSCRPFASLAKTRTSMTQPPPPGNYPPPPGNYPPPPPGNYPPPPPPGAGVLPKEAYTPWIKRVGAWIIDGLIPGILVGIGEIVAFATGENNCISNSEDNNYGVSCTSQPSGLGMIVLFVFVLAAAVFAFWNLYRQGKTGSTIGKSV